MTNDEWQQLEKHLFLLGSRANLQIDEFNITLIVEPEKLLKNVIVLLRFLTIVTITVM
ncbi:hypothetical protein Osc1_10810 [Hominimerdicola sp. 21CYCFAH17_S]